MTTVVLLSVISFAAGFVDSIAGGGGLILLPSLLSLGIVPQTALGTNKFASTLGTSVSALSYTRHGKIVWKAVIIGIPFTFIGSFLGARAVLFLDNRTIGKFVFFLLPIAFFVMMLKKKKKRPDKKSGPFKYTIAAAGTGFLLGLYDGFFGPGTGTVLIIAFGLFLGMGLVEATGSAKIFNLGSNLMALLVFGMNGRVDYHLGAFLAVSNMAGNFLGSRMAIKKGQSLVKYVLAVSVSILLVTLFVKYFVA